MTTTFLKKTFLDGLIIILLVSIFMTMGCGPVVYYKNSSMQAQRSMQANREGDCALSIKIARKELDKLKSKKAYQLKHVPLTIDLVDCYLEMHRTEDAIWEVKELLRFIEEQESLLSHVNGSKYYSLANQIQDSRLKAEDLRKRAKNQKDNDVWQDNLEYEDNEYITDNLYYALKDLNQENFQQAEIKFHSLFYSAPEFQIFEALNIYSKLCSFSTQNNDFTLEELNELEWRLKKHENIINLDRLLLLSYAHLADYTNHASEQNTSQGNKTVLDLYEKAESASKMEIEPELEKIIQQSSRSNMLTRALYELDELIHKDIKRSIKHIKAHFIEQDIKKPQITIDPQPWGEMSRYSKAIISGVVSDDMSVEHIFVNDKEIDFVRSQKSDDGDIVDFVTSIDLYNGRNEITIEAFDAAKKECTEKLFLTFTKESYRKHQIKGRWGIFLSVFDYEDSELPSRDRFGTEDDSQEFMAKLSDGIPTDQCEILQNDKATKQGILNTLDDLVDAFNEANNKVKAEEILLYLDLWCYNEFVKTEMTPYLIPFDAKRNEITQTSINLIDVLKILKRCRTAKRILLITNNDRVEEHFRNLSDLKDDRFVIVGASGGKRRLRKSSFLSHAVGELKRLTLYDMLPESLFYKSPPPSFQDLFTRIRKKTVSETGGKQIPVLLGSAPKAEKFSLPSADTNKIMFYKISDLFIAREISRSAYLRALPIITNQFESYTDHLAVVNLVKYLRKSINKEKLQQILVTERSEL
jgi:hypothetical protein